MISVLGIGVVGSFGAGKDAFIQALAAPNDCASSHYISEYQKDVEVHLAKTEQLSDYVPKPKQRRMDHFSRMFYLGAMDAIKDSGLTEDDLQQYRVGVVCATAYGASKSSYAFKDSINTKADHFASPLHFSKSVANSAIANFMLNMNFYGRNITICQPQEPFEASIEVACLWLEQDCDLVILVAVDEFSAPLAYSQERMQETEDGLIPDGSLGEGCSAFILSSTSCKEKSKYPSMMTDLNSTDSPLAFLKQKIFSYPFGYFPTNTSFTLMNFLLAAEK
ncbi:MAG: beta-ketoacyl synthase chain length factor [Desulfotalea sp.]